MLITFLFIVSILISLIIGYFVGLNHGANFIYKRYIHPGLPRQKAKVNKNDLIHKETIRVYSNLKN